MQHLRKEILENRNERIKSINFCLSTPMSNDEVFNISSNSVYEQGSVIKKALENYLGDVKSKAKEDIVKGEYSKDILLSVNKEIDSISQLVEKIDISKEYRLPKDILQKLNL